MQNDHTLGLEDALQVLCDGILRWKDSLVTPQKIETLSIRVLRGLHAKSKIEPTPKQRIKKEQEGSDVNPLSGWALTRFQPGIFTGGPPWPNISVIRPGLFI
jgi:hypothetical protein